MALTVHTCHGVAVVEVTGELDHTQGPAFGQICEELLADNQRQIVLDLHGLEFIDSAGLAMLIRGFQRVRASAGSLVLAALLPPVQRIFALMRLDRIFEIYHSVDEAIRHYRGT